MLTMQIDLTNDTMTKLIKYMADNDYTTVNYAISKLLDTHGGTE